MNRGYIKLYRKIRDNAIFDETENRFSAWVDLLMMVNHKDNSFVLGMQKINVKRGQKWTSIGKLAERWGWCRKKTKAYLKLLESEGMIYLDISNRGLLITIVNYGLYQDFLPQGEQQKEQQKTQQKEQQGDNKRNIRRNTKRQTNNNVNNDIKNDLNNDSKMSKKPSADSDSCEVVYEE